MDDKKKSSPMLVIGVIIAIIVVIFIWKALSNKSSVEPIETDSQSNSSAVLSDNIIIVSQRPGRFINVRKAVLSKDGYIVVHQEEAGSVGSVIGSSSLLSKGEYKDISVTLNRKSKAGESLYGMIHHDNGDGTLDPSNDAIAKDANGNDAIIKFLVNDTASEPIDLKL